MVWHSTGEERCVYAGGKTVQTKKCREEGRSLQEILVECWKEEITEKWLDRKLCMHFLCYSSYFSHLHICHLGPFFFLSIYNFSTPPLRQCHVHLFTQINLYIKNEQGNNVNFTFILSFLPRTNTPSPLSVSFNVLFLMSKIYLFSCDSLLWNGFKSPYHTPLTISHCLKLQHWLRTSVIHVT